MEEAEVKEADLGTDEAAETREAVQETETDEGEVDRVSIEDAVAHVSIGVVVVLVVGQEEVEEVEIGHIGHPAGEANLDGLLI